MRLNAACAAATALGLTLAACQQREPAAPAPVQTSSAPETAAAAPVSYACESGQAITVAYTDTATAQLNYKGQVSTLRSAQAASGARYTGSALEWATVNRDGQESATLSRLGPNDAVGTTVLERCSRPSVSPVPIDPAPVGQAGMLSSAVPCRGPQLRLSNEGGDAGAGNRVANIGIQNVGAQACSLTGYPGVVLQDGQGRNLTAVRAEQAAGSYFTQGQTPAPVTLAPQEKAAFELAWSVIPNEAQGESVCPSAARVRVTPPDDTSPVSLDMPFTPCGGRVRVSPIRPLTAPAS